MSFSQELPCQLRLKYKPDANNRFLIKPRGEQYVHCLSASEKQLKDREKQKPASKTAFLRLANQSTQCEITSLRKCHQNYSFHTCDVHCEEKALHKFIFTMTMHC